jgi:Flp pilus assembly protein TadG
MFHSAIATTEQLRRDERGGVALMFGLSAVAVCMMVGMAFDVGRAMSSKAKVAAAADAAALAAVKAVRLEGLSVADAKSLARRVFDENMRNGSGRWTTVHDVVVDIDPVNSRATVDVDSSVATTFAAISGITKLGSPGTATAMFETRNIEVGVQLDLTGSMCSPCSKLDDLKEATKTLVDVLIPATPTAQSVRVGFAPFSAGVNVGSYLRQVDGDRASVNNCVYERRSTTNDRTDEPPIGMDAYKIRADFAHPVQNCPAASIVPLTSDRELLKDTVDTFNATGTTAGQLGAAWAWNLISPKWSNVWPVTSTPAAYGTANTDKIVILMTDGVYNTVGGVMSSANAVAASRISVDICTNMIELGITVYTVGFDLDSIANAGERNRATNTLKDCAGRKGHPNPEEFFYKAEDGAALKSAFNNIATDIMRLRLSN